MNFGLGFMRIQQASGCLSFYILREPPSNQKSTTIITQPCDRKVSSSVCYQSCEQDLSSQRRDQLRGKLQQNPKLLTEMHQFWQEFPWKFSQKKEVWLTAAYKEIQTLGVGFMTWWAADPQPIPQQPTQIPTQPGMGLTGGSAPLSCPSEAQQVSCTHAARSWREQENIPSGFGKAKEITGLFLLCYSLQTSLLQEEF